MRVQEESQLTGATYIVAGSCVCSFISTIDEGFAASAFLSLTLFILGDAAAALCGKAFGKYKIEEKHLKVFGLFSSLCFAYDICFSCNPNISQKLEWGFYLVPYANFSICGYISGIVSDQI